MPWYLGNSSGSWNMPGLVIPLVIWSAVWTGFALWYAARKEQKGWFVFFLLVHTAGIAEILYLVFVVKVLRRRR